jgi:hypothetical protein
MFFFPNREGVTKPTNPQEESTTTRDGVVGMRKQIIHRGHRCSLTQIGLLNSGWWLMQTANQLLVLERQLVRGSVASHCNNHSRIYKTTHTHPAMVSLFLFTQFLLLAFLFLIYYKNLELTLRGYRAAAAQSVISKKN